MTQRKPRVLVVTDRFPPEVEGGAEWSLHDTLGAMAADLFEIRVIALSTTGVPTQETVSGLPVDRVRFDPLWPQAVSQLRSEGATRRELLGALSLEALKTPRSARDLLKFSALKVMRPTDDHPGVEAATVESASAARKAIAASVREWQPDIVHADNKDSILLVASVSRGESRFVAMVRDHRFFCGHARQEMNVAEVACTSCSYGCVDHLSRPWRAWLTEAMHTSTQARREALKMADAVVTTSRHLADEVESLGVARSVQVIGAPHPAVDLFPADYQDPADPSEVLFAGNLRPGKGAEVLVDIFPSLKAAAVRRIVLAGDGPLASEIRSKADRDGFGDGIELTGLLPRSELYKRIMRATVVVAPTLAPEGFGRLALEAGIARRPIVASALGGHLETVLDGETGMLVAAGDRNELAEAVTGLLGDRERARRMGEAARRHIERRFSPEAVAWNLAQAWRSAIASS